MKRIRLIASVLLPVTYKLIKVMLLITHTLPGYSANTEIAKVDYEKLVINYTMCINQDELNLTLIIE